jgi:arginase
METAMAANDRTPQTVVAVPQWQGSGSPDARRLADGARLLAALIPAGTHVTVDVPAHGGTPSGGVQNRDVLAEVARRTQAVLGNGFTVTVGGDCGADLAAAAAAVRLFGDDLTVVWLDAHGDLNTPESSPSGAFHGMVLRTLLGDGPPDLVPSRRLRPDRVVLAGTRALDPGEADFLAREDIKVVSVEDIVDAVDTEAVYVHIDLDVLDPGVFGAVGYPEPGGLTVEQLAGAVSALRAARRVVGMGIMEFMPRSPADAALAQLVADALFQRIR